MRHYEIVILIHPDQSDQVSAMKDRYQLMVKEGGGKIHRKEDWGRMQLAYEINKVHKAHFLLMNIECSQSVLDALRSSFSYNDAVIRHLILKRDGAITASSPIMQALERGKSRKEKASKTTAEEAAETSEEA